MPTTFLLSIALAILPLLPSTTAFTNLTRTLYCPFDVKLSPSSDLNSLDLTYTPTSTPSNPFYIRDGCLIEIYLNSPDNRGDVYFEEISYRSNTAMKIDTKAAWDSAIGPILYAPIALPAASSSSDSVVFMTRNVTTHTAPRCQQKPHSKQHWYVFLQTKFNYEGEVGKEFFLEQKAKLRWAGSEVCEMVDDCDEADIDGKFPSCHGVPGKRPWDD